MLTDINSFEFQAKLQQYLSGDLPEVELQELEVIFQESETVRAEWLFSQQLYLVNKHKDLVAVHQIAANSIERTGWRMPATSIGARWKFWSTVLLGLGLATVLIVLSVRYFKLQEQIRSYQQLSAQYFEPLEPLLITNTQVNQTLDRAMQWYGDGDYTRAASSFEAYLEQEGDWNAALYLGISHMAEGKSQAAIEALQLVQPKEADPIYAAAQWYLSLAYLSTGDNETARIHLEKLQADALYGSSATQLLQQLAQLE